MSVLHTRTRARLLLLNLIFNVTVRFSMKWKDKHFVTVKRLHGNTVEGGCVDLLIEELEILR